MDHSENSQEIMRRLADPAIEMRYLLDRGYNRSHVLRFVGDHHQLNRDDRNVLERVVFSKNESKRRKSRYVSSADVRSQDLIIDGYNILISIECLLHKEPLFKADDGIVRDCAFRRGLLRGQDTTQNAIKLLCDLFGELSLNSMEVIFDRQISYSGELVVKFKEILSFYSFLGIVRTEIGVDHTIKEALRRNKSLILCSSDRAIIDVSHRTFDVVSELAAQQGIKLGKPPHE